MSGPSLTSCLVLVSNRHAREFRRAWRHQLRDPQLHRHAWAPPPEVYPAACCSSGPDRVRQRVCSGPPFRVYEFLTVAPTSKASSPLPPGGTLEYRTRLATSSSISTAALLRGRFIVVNEFAQTLNVSMHVRAEPHLRPATGTIVRCSRRTCPLRACFKSYELSTGAPTSTASLLLPWLRGAVLVGVAAVRVHLRRGFELRF